MKKLCFFSLFIASFLTASAYRLEWGRTVTINQPVFEDLYIAGGTVTLNAPVYGDVIVAGGTIIINDSIGNDLLLAGGEVEIKGYVADDIRCAGGELRMLKSIGGDLVITGGRVSIAPVVVVGGSLIIAGGEVVSNGQVIGETRAAAANVVFNGVYEKGMTARCEQLTVTGTVKGNVVLAAREITLGKDAAFTGNVRYWSKTNKPNFAPHVQSGIATFDPSLKLNFSNWFYLGHSTALGLVWYLSTVLLFLIIIQYLFGNTFKKAGDTVSNSLWKSLGYGLAFFCGCSAWSSVIAGNHHWCACWSPGYVFLHRFNGFGNDHRFAGHR